jgi:hypothetical protein
MSKPAARDQQRGDDCEDQRSAQLAPDSGCRGAKTARDGRSLPRGAAVRRGPAGRAALVRPPGTPRQRTPGTRRIAPMGSYRPSRSAGGEPISGMTIRHDDLNPGSQDSRLGVPRARGPSDQRARGERRWPLVRWGDLVGMGDRSPQILEGVLGGRTYPIGATPNDPPERGDCRAGSLDYRPAGVTGKVRKTSSRRDALRGDRLSGPTGPRAFAPAPNRRVSQGFRDCLA